MLRLLHHYLRQNAINGCQKLHRLQQWRRPGAEFGGGAETIFTSDNTTSQNIGGRMHGPSPTSNYFGGPSPVPPRYLPLVFSIVIRSIIFAKLKKSEIII